MIDYRMLITYIILVYMFITKPSDLTYKYL